MLSCVCENLGMGQFVNGTICEWDQLRLGLYASGEICKWDQLRLGQFANGTDTWRICEWDYLLPIFSVIYDFNFPLRDNQSMVNNLNLPSVATVSRAI